MKKELSDRINRFNRFLLRIRKTLSNFNPLPEEADDPVRQVIRFVPFFPLLVCLLADKSKGTKIKVIL
ncbi:MAG: hypothetical protein HY787_20835 [Deltaproteobacteria bacterium]|nr:hypothetical protein [Deltaproteobacteria bacterium]